ncbi:hypothetical protein LCGC14_0693650 [marine sediment metagenome]|uniref:Uncharacterized protein n=1 Tax=marine sediment metagenome TaxID=412755 RepID=A0A0F9QPM7_9ZZZZ
MSEKSFGPDWQPDEPAVLEGAGVVYSFDPVDGFTSFSYTAKYKGLVLSRRVYVTDREDFERLLVHWNLDERWIYTAYKVDDSGPRQDMERSMYEGSY